MIFIWPVLFCFLSFFGGIAFNGQDTSNQEQDQANVQVIGGQFLVYRNAVLAYSETHPGATMTVHNSDLSLPAWFTEAASYQAVLQAGTSYVFYTPTGQMPALSSMGLYPTGEVTASVGVAQNGVLVSPTLGNTGITLPASIPSGSIVYIN